MTFKEALEEFKAGKIDFAKLMDIIKTVAPILLPVILALFKKTEEVKAARGMQASAVRCGPDDRVVCACHEAIDHQLAALAACVDCLECCQPEPAAAQAPVK